jgi:GH24 family phage-related lysozyme (muramidase)
VAEAERGVRRQVPDQALTQAQFDALVSLVYNTGVAGAVNVFALVNDGKLKETGSLIASMIKARLKGKDGKKTYVVLKGLIIRRAEEAKPFFDADK